MNGELITKDWRTFFLYAIGISLFEKKRVNERRDFLTKKYMRDIMYSSKRSSGKGKVNEKKKKKNRTQNYFYLYFVLLFFYFIFEIYLLFYLFN